MNWDYGHSSQLANYQENKTMSIEELLSNKGLTVAFHHIEKCGGLSLDLAFRRRYGLRYRYIIEENKWAQQSDPIVIHRECMQNKLQAISGHTLRPISKYLDTQHFISITLIREPVMRYISDFLYCKSRGFFKGGIEDWMKDNLRANHISKYLCGHGKDPKECIAILDRCNLIADSTTLDHLTLAICGTIVRRNVSSRIMRQTAISIEQKYGGEIRSINSTDIEVWNWFRNSGRGQVNWSSKENQTCKTNQAQNYCNLIANTLFREAIYKPSRGVWPSKDAFLPLHSPNSISESDVRNLVNLL